MKLGKIYLNFNDIVDENIHLNDILKFLDIKNGKNI